MFGKFDQRSASRTSVEKAWWIARNKQPYTLGQNLLKPAVSKNYRDNVGSKISKETELSDIICEYCKTTNFVFSRKYEGTEYFRIKTKHLLFTSTRLLILEAIHSKWCIFATKMQIVL